MNVTSYLQQRQYGGLPRKKNSLAHVENYVEGRVASSFVNKACTMPGRCRSTFVVEFSPDGTKVASTHGDHSVRVSDIATSKCVKTLTGHPRTPWCLAYHPSSNHILASGCLHGQVRIWDLYGHGCEVWQTDNTTVIASLTFHPTDHVLVIAAGNTIYFWDWSKPEPFAKCSTTHEFERIRWVKFDHLGNYLYTGISNNNSIHRDNVASTATPRGESSEERPPGQPTRLSSVYNNIVTCFHEYQRDRVMQEYNPPPPPLPQNHWSRRSRPQQSQGIEPYSGLEPRGPEGERARSPLTLPDSFPESDFNPSQLRNRHNEILLGSYSELLAQRARARSNRDNRIACRLGGNPRQSGHNDSVRETPLINTRSDPFMPRIPELGHLGEFGEVQRMRAVVNERAGLRDGLGEVGVVQGVIGGYSPPPVPVMDSVGDNLESREENILCDFPSLETGIRDNNDRSATLGADSTPSLDSELIDNSCTEELSISSESRFCDGISNQTVGALNRSAVVSCDNKSVQSNTRARTDSLLSRLNSVRPQPTSQRFRSIRDRLQTSIPLSLDSGTGLPGGPVRVISSTELNNTIPQVTVVSGSNVCSITPTVGDLTCPSTQTEPPRGSMEHYTGELISRLVQDQGSSLSQSRTTGSSNCDNGLGNQSASSSQLQNQSDSSSASASSSLGGGSSLFHSMFPRSGIINPGRYSRYCSAESRLRAAKPASTGSHPYHPWQNRSRGPYLPLLSPYLESRGVRTSQEESTPTSRSSIDSFSFVPRTLGCSTRTVTSTAQQTVRDTQTPSDTENELSSHLTQSGAYFMPISNHPRRTLSSASSCSTSSADRNSNPTLSSGDTSTESTVGLNSRSSSQGQGQELELTVDQNDNYSASQVPNANIVNRSEIRHETHDDNNNSIHIVQPVPDVQPTIHISQSTLHGTQRTTDIGLPSSLPVVQMTSLTTPSLPSFKPPTSFSAESTSQSTVPDTDNVDRVMGSAGTVDRDMGSAGNVDRDMGSAGTVDRDMGSAGTVDRDMSSAGTIDSDMGSADLATTTSVATTLAQTPGDYATLRNTFYNMTSQIEREMSDLNRRINALRESFNESLLALRQDRQRFENIGSLIEETASGLPPVSSVLEMSEESQEPPAITITRARDTAGSQQVTSGTGVAEPDVPLSQPLTLLESSLRSHRWNRQSSTNIHDSASAQESAGSQQELVDRDPHSWRYLHRHYLHPHYSSSILDETINRPNTAIQSAINRAIAGAFMGTGEAAVANNIINQTHRIQYWDFSKCDIPDITSNTKNIVVGHCKLHNSASCDISRDGTLLATFVPSHQGFPDDNILTVYSLRPESRGQCLFTKSFGPNAISISISPGNKHVLVGLAAKRLSWVFTSDQLVAQIYRLEKESAGEKSMKHVKDIMHSCNMGIRAHVSGNSARWLPLPGQGIVYGTNRGDLHLCKPGVKVIVEKTDQPEARRSSDSSDSSRNIRRCLLGRVPWLNYSATNNPHRISTATQTNGIRRTASTQTEQDDADNLVFEF